MLRSQRCPAWARSPQRADCGRRHTSRYLIIFLTFLPFALWRVCKWLTPGVAGVVAFLLMGVENIGVQIEQPFSVLPLELFCSIIKINIMEALEVRSKPWRYSLSPMVHPEPWHPYEVPVNLSI